MTYDASEQATVLFGGSDSKIVFQNDTWIWDGQTWTQVATPNAPSAREHASMVYDAAFGRVILFGGTNRAVSYGDTWEWDGTDWSEATPSSSPPPRIFAAMAYDSDRNRVVLFGGETNWIGANLGDTWEWDGQNWLEIRPSISPSPRFGASMVYDDARKRILLFGGENASGAVFGDLWEWDGTQWKQEGTSLGPAPRAVAALAFDSARDVAVLFGGTVGTTKVQDTWEWNGVAWNQRSPAQAPPQRTTRAIVYDDVAQRMVLFGGGGSGTGARFGDTWTYSVNNASAYSTIGAGCPGSASGVPMLTARTAPTLGQDLFLSLDNAPPGSPGGLIFGATPTSFSLASIGAPGCFVYANPHVVVPFITDLNGSWFNPPAFPVPNSGSLVGACFWNQCALIDPRANQLGVIVSNANKATVGY